MRELAGLPLAVGVGLADALAGHDVPVRLKWPNDLLLDGAKLAGILIETGLERSGPGRPVWAVIGVGMNLALPEELARKIGRPAASLPELVARDRNHLLGTLLNGLAGALRQFEREGFAAFMARWNALHAWAGQAVQIQDHGRIVLEGVAAGVDAQGQLLLETAAGQVSVLAGDVSLRRKDNGSEEYAVAG
jgi:BirA family biotin operon repressor/biotin-[acetyl-CoA-carboxylase] ligase